MDTTTIIIGIIVIALCTLPFVFMARKQKKEKIMMISTFNEMAQKENCKITSYKLFGDSVIGIDKTAKFAFFFKKNSDNDKEIRQAINLRDIKKCRVVKSIRSVGEKNKVLVVDKVELSLLPKDRNKPEVLFEFFNADNSNSIQLNGELQFASEWEEIINSMI